MLARKVASGAMWLVGARLATRALDLVSLLIVARLLVPEDFGLFALAATVLLVLNAVTDLSLSNAIVQMSDPDDTVYDTAFTLSVLRGVVLCAAMAACAWPFAWVYGDPRLAPIVMALAAVPILRGMVSPRMAFLQRQMIFRPLFYLEAWGKLAAFAVSVAAALATRNYWALVAGMIAAPFISTAASYYFAPYRPAFGFAHWKPIFAFSGWLTLSNTVNTLNWQADRLFIGQKLGPAVLGQYTVGSELASLPTNAPILPIMQALYAGFAKLSADLARLRTAYLTSQSVVVAIALPIAVTVSVFAHSIIRIAIGPEWAASAFVVQVLAPIFALQMVTAPAQSIAMVRGKTSSIFYRDCISLAVRLPLIFVGIALAGLEGAVWARVASGLFIILLNLLLMKRLLEISVSAQVLTPWRSYVSAILLAVFLVAAGGHFALLDTGDPLKLAELVLVAGAGMAIYGAVHLSLWAISRPADSAEGKMLDIVRQVFWQSKRMKAAE